MTYLKVVLTALLSVAVLFAITRITGYRQLAEMSLFDYINGITIGSIAAELAIAPPDKLVPYLIAMVIYGAATLLVAFAGNKSSLLRRFFIGRPIILMEKGKLDYNGFRRARLNVNEFLTKCRSGGYFDISTLDTVLLEPNGKLSFLPVSDEKPVTAKEMGIVVRQESLAVNVVVDGKIMRDNLSLMGKSEIWLYSRLKNLGSDDVSKIFLAICSGEQISVFEKS